MSLHNTLKDLSLKENNQSKPKINNKEKIYPVNNQYPRFKSTNNFSNRFNDYNRVNKPFEKICYTCGKRGHVSAECYHNTSNKAHAFNIKNCNNCKKDGHTIDECRKRQIRNPMANIIKAYEEEFCK
ncbi:hypothetical protein V9T40_013837 [Parthenolecanium corni]|uniref:CCHC-type domain-containing protein n=1 Tax=Parthenolecanium corni TaxID=536013 RepID=A0AAN9TDI7_9HEMI